MKGSLGEQLEAIFHKISPQDTSSQKSEESRSSVTFEVVVPATAEDGEVSMQPQDGGFYEPYSEDQEEYPRLRSTEGREVACEGEPCFAAVDPEGKIVMLKDLRRKGRRSGVNPTIARIQFGDLNVPVELNEQMVADLVKESFSKARQQREQDQEEREQKHQLQKAQLWATRMHTAVSAVGVIGLILGAAYGVKAEARRSVI